MNACSTHLLRPIQRRRYRNLTTRNSHQKIICCLSSVLLYNRINHAQFLSILTMKSKNPHVVAFGS
jgi:hypothetical protein